MERFLIMNICMWHSIEDTSLFNEIEDIRDSYKCQRVLRAPYRRPIKFYLAISNQPIIIIRGDELKSISFLYRKLPISQEKELIG